MKITQEKINLLAEMNLSVEEGVFLYALKYGEFLVNLSIPRLKKLELAGFLEDGGLTIKGEDLAVLLSDNVSTSNLLKEEFEELWKAYPLDDGSDLHIPTRKLKGNKQEAYQEYAKVRTENSKEEILSGLTNEINFRRGIPDRFKYMKNITNWLKFKVYLNYTEETDYKDIYGKEII